MRKQLFSMMLCLGAVGGASFVTPMTAMAAVAQDQVITVKGQVVDDQGEPLIGATVKTKDAKTGAVTDLDGNFEIKVKANATLLVSYLGFKERQIAVRGRAILEPIQLSSDNQLLEQVVVVGYGTQKKADLTGSVAIVNAEEMKKVSNSNISTMLEGKVAGVQITSDGQPGADPSVRIRGIGSFGSTAPLYVIDGVPMGTTIRDFSPNDIETIQILKDASAGAIYGSRAANGVVIITTKNGKKDQPLKVNYSGYFGVDQIPGDVYDVMNADQYSNYLGQACSNSNTPLPGGYRTVAEAVSHVVTVHGSHILVLTDVLVTELTVAGTNLEHVNDVAADWEELFLIEAPAQRYRWEGCPTDVLAQAGATITTYYCRNQVLLSIVIVQTAYV
jgi:TonB-dependent starch-binding outer membrane protein SusC